jgi:rSAM/selenodomain-associated transferase 2
LIQDPTPISIVVPVLNEGAVLLDVASTLLSVQASDKIIVDGGSDDDTVDFLAQIPEQDGFRIIRSEPGRARQMNAGAALANGEILLFLHADTYLPGDIPVLLAPVFSGEYDWGRFDVHFDDEHFMMRIVSWMMNVRSCITGIATGDQAIFVRTNIFREMGGFVEIPLMEDIELCRRLRKIGRPLCIGKTVTTSARRWRKNGILRTIFLMWGLRLGFWLGVPPERLAHWYKHSRE